MREIRTPNGEVYLRVELNEKHLRLQPARYQNDNFWFVLDAKVVPQLSEMLREAEFFKCL